MDQRTAGVIKHLPWPRRRPSPTTRILIPRNQDKGDRKGNNDRIHDAEEDLDIAVLKIAFGCATEEK